MSYFIATASLDRPFSIFLIELDKQNGTKQRNDSIETHRAVHADKFELENCYSKGMRGHI